MLTITNFIEGELVDPVEGRWLENVEPATGLVYSRLPASGPEDVGRAADAAARREPEVQAAR